MHRTASHQVAVKREFTFDQHRGLYVHLLHVPVCCLSDMGTVLKVVTIPRESWHDLEEVVLEEMTVFRV